MRTKFLAVCSAAVFLLVVSIPMFAHHGTSIYDLDNPITLQGSLTKVEWSNPHILIFFDVKDDKGNVDNWACELGSPNKEKRDFGYSSDTFKVGDRISVTGSPRRDGRKVIWGERDGVKKLT